MSNNIYDILKKMQSLETPKTSLNEGKKVCDDCGKVKCECMNESAKPDFLDMDKDGDKEESMKDAAKDKSKGAIAEAVARVEQQLAEKYMGFKKTVAAIKKGGSAENPEAVAAAIGRKKYGKAKFQKAAAAGKKLGEGSIEDVVTKASDAVVKQLPGGKEEIDRRKKYNADFKKAKEDGTEVPAMYSGFAGKSKMKEGEYNEDMLSPGQKKIARMSPPPDKIDANDLAALRAGKKKKAEGNEFSGELAKAKAQHKDSFEVDGKTYPVKEGFPTVADAQKRDKEQSGKTAHGTKSHTKTGVKHERDYDKDEPTGERGRPKKDKFAK